MNIILYVIDCGVTMENMSDYLLYLKYCKPPFELSGVSVLKFWVKSVIQIHIHQE